MAKEQLIWNTIICAIYGPELVRPKPRDSRPVRRNGPRPNGAMTSPGKTVESLLRGYVKAIRDAENPPDYGLFATSAASQGRPATATFAHELAAQLATLGYSIKPLEEEHSKAVVYALVPSEVECLAMLAHRSWLGRQRRAGWSYGDAPDAANHLSPDIASWDELGNRTREWARRPYRDLPALLATAGFGIVRS